MEDSPSTTVSAFQVSGKIVMETDMKVIKEIKEEVIADENSDNIQNQFLMNEQNFVEELMSPLIVIKEELNLIIKEEPVEYIHPTEFVDVGEPTFQDFEIKAEEDYSDEKHGPAIEQTHNHLPPSLSPSPKLKKPENSTTNECKQRILKVLQPKITYKKAKTDIVETENNALFFSSEKDILPEDSEPSDLLPVALDSKCRGCGQSYTQLIRHLQPFTYKVTACMRHYSSAEIENHKKVLANCSECVICSSKIHKSYLPIHKALIHFKEQYLEEIKEKQTCYKVDPESCPWFGCSFALKKNSSHDIRKDIAMIKHYQTHFSILDIIRKYNCIGGDAMEMMHFKNQIETEVNDQHLKRKLFCKACKCLFAVKSDGKLQLINMETNANCNHCQNSNLEVVCRVCNLNIKSPDHYTIEQKKEHIEKHLESDKHSQKEQVFDFYSEYASFRGFDMETDLNMDNLRFFISAMKVKMLHCQIHDKNILSLFVNILNLSMSQYADLQKHMDNLVKSRLPSFWCFPCNFSVVDGIDALKAHVVTEQHEMSISHLKTASGRNKNLSCSNCIPYFNDAEIDEHAGHRLHEEDADPILNSACKSVDKQATFNRKSKTPEIVEENDAPMNNIVNNVLYKEPSPNAASPSDRLPGLIDTKCRGCGRHFPRILKHLQPSKFKVGLCMKNYSSAELEIHKKKLRTIKNIRHHAKSKEITRITGANQSKQIFCKTCKSLFAFKADGNVQLTSLESRSNCNHCKNPNFGLVCRVCNVKLRTLDHFPGPQKYQFIEKHLDSDNHLQKEQVLEFYRIYASIRGFDMECDINVDNLKFFLTAMKVKTLGGKVAAKNCLSVILNILNLSSSQYNELQEHVDTTTNLGNPNYLCFFCNFLAFGDIGKLREHTETEHVVSSGPDRTSLSCSQCDVFFSDDNIDEHSGHVLNQDYIDSILSRPGQFESQSPNQNRKRKHPGDKDEIN